MDDARPDVSRDPRRTGFAHRAHLLPGCAVALGGALVAAATLRPWVSVTTPSGGIFGLVTIDPGTELQRGLDGSVRAAVLVCGLVVLALGALLARTRLRAQGRVLRAAAGGALVVPVLATLWAWQAVSGVGTAPPTLTAGGLPEVLRSFLASSPDARSLFVLHPAAGMFLVSLGVVLAAVGLVLPAGPSPDDDGRPDPA